MVFAVAVGVAKTINLSTTVIMSTCPIYVGFRPTVFGSSFCITIKFLMSQFEKVIMTSKFNCDAETRSKKRGFEAHRNWTCHMWTG